MINLKGLYLFFLYASYIHYKGREYGDLAANIGSTNEKPFTNIISNQPTILIISNFPKESAFLSLKHLVPLTLGGCKQSHVAG